MLLVAAASSMSACIIPVGPNFQDPPTQPASVPYLQAVDPTPPFGSIVALTAATTSFSVNVTDPDPGAMLQFQWVFDYPQNPSSGPPLPAGTDMITPPKTISLPVNCQSVDTTQFTTHLLRLYVTTGTFDTSNRSVFGKATDPSAKVVGDGWTVQFLMNCQ